MPPYPPETVPGGWWRKSGLLPRTAPDSVANLNQDEDSGAIRFPDLVSIKSIAKHKQM